MKITGFRMKNQLVNELSLDLGALKAIRLLPDYEEDWMLKRIVDGLAYQINATIERWRQGDSSAYQDPGF